MFTFSSISRSLEFWSVNHTSIYENSESKGCKNFLTFLKYVTINQMIYLEQIHTRLLNLADNRTQQYYSVLILRQ